MDRRGFFKAIAGTAVGVTSALVLPELDLWKPSRTYFLPPKTKTGWTQGGVLNVGDVVTFEGVAGLWVIGERSTTALWTVDWNIDSDFLSGDQWTPAQQQRMLGRSSL